MHGSFALGISHMTLLKKISKQSLKITAAVVTVRLNCLICVVAAFLGRTGARNIGTIQTSKQFYSSLIFHDVYTAFTALQLECSSL